MTKTSRGPVVLNSLADGTVFDADTGEVVVERGRVRLVRGYAASVEHIVSRGMPDTPFRLIADKNGRVVSAIGTISISSLDMAFPGCSTADDIRAATVALKRAGLSKGNSPAGRALDFAMRTNPEVSQWRMRREVLSEWSQSLYGGIQFGGPDAPPLARGRIAMDVNSSYPFLATQALPRIRDVAFERGLRPHALLVRIEAEQTAPALFSRCANGTTEYRERLHGWYCADEVNYHADMGRVRVLSVTQSATAPREEPYLAATIDTLYTHRERWRRGSVERGVVKSAMNGLLGKFAAPISPWRSPRAGELEHIQRTRHANVLHIGRGALVNDPSLRGLYPRHANVLWTALTYARARVRLWQKFDEITAAGGTVLWAHTDSVTADVPKGYVPTVGTALGDWRLIQSSDN